LTPPIDLLVIKTGTTEAQVVAEYGDYDDWFAAHLHPQGVRTHIIQAFEDEALPEASQFDGVLLTGSPASVRDETPWMSELAAWTLRAAQAEQPILAVCFGHQLLGEALGGYIRENPAGPEFGSIELGLTPEGRSDPLFEGLRSPMVVQSTHRDVLIQPPSATLLASTENTEWQAFSWRSLRAVQFHPEIPPEALRALFRARGIEAEVDQTHHGLKILDNWLNHYLRSPRSVT